MLVRCESHPSKNYRFTANPVGYPKTAAICGRCGNPGKVLLNDVNGANTKPVKLSLVSTATLSGSNWNHTVRTRKSYASHI
jgi:hypothetical protein